MLGVTGVNVTVGQGVGVKVGVGLRYGVLVGGTGLGVCVGRGVRVGISVAVGRGVRVDVEVGVKVSVFVGVLVGKEVGGIPVTSKKPETFQVNPVKICTSYVPGSHSCCSGFQSVKPRPPVSPSQGKVSK